MGMLFLAAILNLTSQLAWAHQIEDIYARRLTSAARPGEVDRLKAEYEDLSVSLIACRLQMDRDEVPVACYKRRRSLRAWLPKSSGDDVLPELNRRCRRATRALRVPGEAINLSDLSPECRDRVAQARRILRYREGSERTWSED